MKTAIIGCGLNSDYHIRFIKNYAGTSIVGIVDSDRAKAQACGEKHSIRRVYASFEELYNQDRPDVVHIVTPPRTHSALAKQALQYKCHVLIEKPITLSAPEAAELYDLAEQQNVKICAMHNHFFDPCMERAKDLIRRGCAGDVMNVESYYGLNTKIPAFREYPSPNVLPWLYTLPGGVYHDFMSHPLYVLLEYTGKPRELKVFKKSHGTLPQGMPDELKIAIDGEKAFGTVTFSFAAEPHLHFLRLYGHKMMVEVDFNTMTTITHPVSSLPKAAQKATYNLSEARQLFGQTVSNVINFVRGKLKPYHGMQILIHRFYGSIQGNGDVPVTREQAMLVIETMDEIWKQLQPKPLVFAPIIPEPHYPVQHQDKILVTGGTGFLGRRVVERLVSEGYAVRVLARKLSNIEPLTRLGVEIYYGDVADPVSLAAAGQGMNVIVHAAAGTSGSIKDSELATIQGTQNVLDMCERNGVRKLIYISSCSVYGIVNHKTKDPIAEAAPLEQHPAKRGAYSASKQQAELMVSRAMARNAFPIVILRPGTIYGPGGEYFTPMMGFSLFKKVFLVIGTGTFELPFVFIDNLVDAIVLSISNSEADGNIFNIVDTPRMNKQQYMQMLIKKLYPRSRVVYIPYRMLYLITAVQELVLGLLHRNPFLTRYRLESSQKSVVYDTSTIKRNLNWSPRITNEQAIAAIIQFESKSSLPGESAPGDRIAPAIAAEKP